MDTVIFFILINLLFCTEIIAFNVYFWIIFTGSIVCTFLPDCGMSEFELITRLLSYAGWFLLIFIKIFFLIYMDKICKRDVSLGIFFEKLKNSLRFRIIVLSIAALLDLSAYLFYFHSTDIFFIDLLFLYLFLGTGVILSYISLYIWFDIQKIISFIKKRMCKQG